ncbi:MAG: GGDEF domain-containing protein [Clostridiaceae bacterium]|nr:GGDEF domain-containing protein [Clostridiaceae bacterium]
MDNIAKDIINKLNLGIIVIDSNQNIVMWNNWLERFTKKTKLDTINQKLVDICPRFSEMKYQNMIETAILKGLTRFCSSSLHDIFISPAINYYNDIINKQNLLIEPISIKDEVFVVLQIHDITFYHSRMLELKNFITRIEHEYVEVKASESLNKQLALHDSLTELPNRLLFNERLLWGIKYAQRNKTLLAVIFLDLDGFKNINDTYGHTVGDILLKLVANRLLSTVRQTDTVARLGGDEFIILLTEIKDVAAIELIVNKLLKCFNYPFEINNLSISASIGISIYPQDGQDSEQLINSSDLAMYKVKNAGKNGYSFSYAND